MILFAVIIGLISLLYTGNLVEKLKAEERKRVEIWAEATRQVINATDTVQNLEFLSDIIEGNTTVPVIWTDETDRIIAVNNFDPQKTQDARYLAGKLGRMKEKREPIIINLPGGDNQKVYYRDSIILRQLIYYPYVQLGVILLFIVVSYMAFSSSRKARDFELIISDNASTDRTGDIVLEYQHADSRILYFRQDANIGISRNYQFVLRQARGAMFMWASHDDIWAESWLEVLTQNITPQDSGVRGALILFRNRETIAEKQLPDFPRKGLIRCFLGNESNCRSHYAYSLFYREKLLALPNDIFLLDYYPDAILVYAMLHYGALRTLPQTHLRYRLHVQNCGIGYSSPWKGWRKILYRIHPVRYYLYYLRYTESPTVRLVIAILIPFKHIYAQLSFWVRGFREIISGQKLI